MEILLMNKFLRIIWSFKIKRRFFKLLISQSLMLMNIHNTKIHSPSPSYNQSSLLITWSFLSLIIINRPLLFLHLPPWFNPNDKKNNNNIFLYKLDKMINTQKFPLNNNINRSKLNNDKIWMKRTIRKT